MQEMQVLSLGWEDPLEEKMATHSSILAWEIPQTEESGRLQSMGSQESDTTKHSTVLLRFCALHRTSYLARGGNSLIGLSQSDSTLKFGG